MPIRSVKIIVCGGHFSPALAVIEELSRKNKYKIFYVGSKNVLEGDKVESLEFLTLKKLHIPLYLLSCARLQRRFTLFTIPSLLRFPTSLFKSFILLYKIKPDIILSFGGYVALPLCLVSFFLRIPIVTHEQTQILGLTNRIISKFAKAVLLSFSDTGNIPKGAKTIVTGNPIRLSVISPKKSSLVDFGDKNLPLIYITGGSLGSRTVNRAVFEILPFLVSRFRVLHQTGTASNGQDYLFAERRKKTLQKIFQKNYSPKKITSPADTGGILHEALFIIGRSGANTLTEVEVSGKPAIFIPLPWSAGNEQKQNAEILVKKRSAVMIDQDKLSGENLKETVTKMTRDISFYKKNAEINAGLFSPDAARRVAAVIDSCLSE